jgi:hypothetical protein
VVCLQSQSFLKDEVNNWNNHSGIPTSLPWTTVGVTVAFRRVGFMYYVSPSLIFAADLSLIRTSLPCNFMQCNHIEVLVQGCPTFWHATVEHKALYKVLQWRRDESSLLKIHKYKPVK